MKDEIIKIVLSFIRANWYRKLTCVVLNVVVVFFLVGLLYEYDLAYLFSLKEHEAVHRLSLSELPVLLVGILITTMIWFRSTRLPKNKKNMVGIVVAIVTENEDEKVRLKNDVLRNLEEKINEGQKQNLFNLIEYPEYYAARVTRKVASSFLKKSKAHLLIFGLLKKRLQQGKEKYFFNLDFIVRHAPIPIETSKKFSEVMTEIAPKRVAIDVQSELQGFQITSEWVVYACEYIIGVAAYLTKDFELSAKLHMKLHGELEKIATNLLAIKILKEKNKAHLIESAFQVGLLKYYLYRKSGDRDLLEAIFIGLEKVKQIEPRNYACSLLRSIILFLKDRNVDGALREVRKVPKKANDIWRYNEAFLFAYKGDMERAIKLYKKAFRGFVESHVIEEVEEFISDVLKVEPDKYQLWFCLGMINYHAKGDLELAKADFQAFLGHRELSEFPQCERLAEECMKQIG